MAFETQRVFFGFFVALFYVACLDGVTIDKIAVQCEGVTVVQVSLFLNKTHVFNSFRLTEFPYYVEREWWKKGARTTFWATWRQLRDVKRRELIAEVGPERMRLKAIKFNTVLPQAIRDECADKLTNMPRYSHPSLVLNMCMFTGRQRGKIKPYRVNRHIFRKAADHGQLSGVQRAFW